MSKQKVAILGGGVAAMTAALELTSPKNPKRDDYEITVYQMGWRLGGKCASGRNPDYHHRIEEHGLHIWFGFYENAFRLMREAYKELDRPKSHPLATFDKAFQQHSVICLREFHDKQWKRWDMYFPENSDVPGEGGVLPSLWATAELFIGWLVEGFGRAEGQSSSMFVRFWRGLLKMIFGQDYWFKELTQLAGLVHDFVDALDGDPSDKAKLADSMKKFKARMRKRVLAHASDKDIARRFLICADLGLTGLAGLIKDGVIGGETSFNDLDKEELKDWLKRHGAEEETLSSAVLRGYYDLAFAYKDGIADNQHQNTGAGTALRAGLRMGLTYKGSFMYKMQAGMGDVVFTPIYQVLKERGVTFKFFHKVENLKLSHDKQSVASIEVARQVDLVGGEAYQPLVDVDGMECWPSEPLYEQIVQGAELRNGPPPHEQPYNLESKWTPWQNVEQITLTKGEDFDHVVLGISIAALPDCCEELIAHSQPWQTMVNKIETVQTQATQLWLDLSDQELGWQRAKFPGLDGWQRVVMDAYEQPLNTWADMSNLLDKEHWPENLKPKSCAYFCGPMKNEPNPPPSSSEFPAQMKAKAKQTAINWFSNNIHNLWPGAAKADDPNCLNWQHLIDEKNSEGVARFDAQYYRANYDPTERYVQSINDTVQYRIHAAESGFDNLWLAGDWTRNGMNVGCVEAATMSGMQASQGLSGYPDRIVGDPRDPEWY